MPLQEELGIFFCNTLCPQNGQTHVKNHVEFGAKFGQVWLTVLLTLSFIGLIL